MNIDKSTEWVLRAAECALGNTPEAIEWIARVYKLGRADGGLEAMRAELERRKAELKEAA